MRRLPDRATRAGLALAIALAAAGCTDASPAPTDSQAQLSDAAFLVDEDPPWIVHDYREEPQLGPALRFEDTTSEFPGAPTVVPTDDESLLLVGEFAFSSYLDSLPAGSWDYAPRGSDARYDPAPPNPTASVYASRVDFRFGEVRWRTDLAAVVDNFNYRPEGLCCWTPPAAFVSDANVAVIAVPTAVDYVDTGTTIVALDAATGDVLGTKTVPRRVSIAADARNLYVLEGAVDGGEPASVAAYRGGNLEGSPAWNHGVGDLQTVEVYGNYVYADYRSNHVGSSPLIFEAATGAKPAWVTSPQVDDPLNGGGTFYLPVGEVVVRADFECGGALPRLRSPVPNPGVVALCESDTALSVTGHAGIEGAGWAEPLHPVEVYTTGGELIAVRHASPAADSWELARLDPETGEALWTRDLPEPINPLYGILDGAAVTIEFVDDDTFRYPVIDLTTGEQLFTPDVTAFARAFTGGDILYLRTSGDPHTLRAFSVSEQREMWSTAFTGDYARIRKYGEWLAILDNEADTIRILLPRR